MAALVCALSIGLFFRDQLASGFAAIFGDVIDARIEVALLEHWYNTLRGLEAWRQPAFFYPAPGVLGYNDGYFLLGIVYAGLRALGCDPFLATELTGMAFRGVGFFAFLLLARRTGLGFGWAALGAALFTQSNAAYLQAAHGQLCSLALAPLFGWMVWTAGAALQRRAPRRAAAWGCAAALLFDAWLLTAFYTAWFTALFALTLALVAVGLGLRDAAWRHALRIPSWPILATAGVVAAGLGPAAMIYLPVLHDVGGHTVATALALTPIPFDFVNTGADSLFYGGLNQWLAQRIGPAARLEGETATGAPWLLLLCAAYGAVVAWRRPWDHAGAFWRAVSAAVLLSAALAVQIGGLTLWLFVYAFVPGAEAIRVVVRYVLFLSLPVTLLAAYGLSRAAGRWPPALIALAGLLLAAETINLQRVDRVPRGEELAWLAQLPPPPASCAAFVVTAPRTLDDPMVTPDLVPMLGSVDAMLIAELIHVPTIDGHASVLPPHHDRPAAEGGDRALAARRLVATLGLGGTVCGLDLAQHAWQPAPLPAAPLPAGRRVPMQAPGGEAAAYLMQGWSVPEATGRWTDGRVAQIDAAVLVPGRDLAFNLSGQPFPLGGPPTTIELFANGHRVATWRPAPGQQILSATIPAGWIGTDGSVSLRLAIASPRRPSEIVPPGGGPASADTRQLGLWVEWFAFSAAGPP